MYTTLPTLTEWVDFFLWALGLRAFERLQTFLPLYFFCVCKLIFSARVVDVVSYVKLLVPINVATKRRTENRCLIILFIFVINKDSVYKDTYFS